MALEGAAQHGQELLAIIGLAQEHRREALHQRGLVGAFRLVFFGHGPGEGIRRGRAGERAVSGSVGIGVGHVEACEDRDLARFHHGRVGLSLVVQAQEMQHAMHDEMSVVRRE